MSYFGNVRPAGIVRDHQSTDPDPDGIDYHTDHHTDHHIDHHFDPQIGNQYYLCSYYNNLYHDPWASGYSDLVSNLSLFGYPAL